MPADKNNEAKLKRLARIGSLIRDRELLEQIGLAYRTLLLRRVRQGKDVHGKSFTGYSSAHASLRKRLGLETHLVNLQMSTYGDAMLEKIDHVVFNDLDGVKAFIDDVEKAKIGGYHARGEGNPTREWWGTSEEHQQKIEGLVTTSLDEIFTSEL